MEYQTPCALRLGFGVPDDTTIAVAISRMGRSPLPHFTVNDIVSSNFLLFFLLNTMSKEFFFHAFLSHG